MMQAEISRQHFQADGAYGLRAAALHIGGLFVLLALAAPLWVLVGPWSAILLVLPISVFTYKLTIVLHDCGHYTLFKSRPWNRRVGRAVGAILGTDFDQYSRVHWQHHRTYGAPEDPQGRDYIGLQNSTRRQILWHLLRPLIGYNFFKLFQLSPTAQPAPARKSLAGFALATLFMQAAIALVASGGGTVPWLVLLYPSSAATLALFLSQIRGFCEHVPRRGHPSEAFVRTHLPNRLDRLLFYGLNFNYHVEHHLYPSVPSRHLPEVHRLVRDRVHTPQTLSPSILHTIADRLRQCDA